MPLTPFNIPQAHHLIAGTWRKGSDVIAVTDPSTGQDLTTIARGTRHDRRTVLFGVSGV